MSSILFIDLISVQPAIAQEIKWNDLFNTRRGRQGINLENLRHNKTSHIIENKKLKSNNANHYPTITNYLIGTDNNTSHYQEKSVNVVRQFNSRWQNSNKS